MESQAGASKRVFDGEMLRPTRYPFESQEQYRQRRSLMSRAVDRYLRGTMAHQSTTIMELAAAGEDVKTDDAIKQRLVRDVITATLPGGKVIRIGRSKGVTYKRA